MQKGTKYDNARHLLALLIVLIAFSVFVLFYYNVDSILEADQFKLFMALATAGMGLLVLLLFLTNHPSHTTKVKTTYHKVTASKAKGKKKKK